MRVAVLNGPGVARAPPRARNHKRLAIKYAYFGRTCAVCTFSRSNRCVCAADRCVQRYYALALAPDNGFLARAFVHTRLGIC